MPYYESAGPFRTLSGVLTSALSSISSLTASRCLPRSAFIRGVSPSCNVSTLLVRTLPTAPEPT